MSTKRFEETGKLCDIQLEDMKLLVNALEPRPPRGAMTIRERYKAEQTWIANLGPIQLAVWTDYMLRNMSPKDTIIYEGAMQEWVLPELIQRLFISGTLNLPPSTSRFGFEDYKSKAVQTIVRILAAIKEGRDVRW